MPSQLESNHDSHQQRLSQYLDDLSKPLPKAEQEIWRSEASQHLEAMVAAYEELGYSHSEAIPLALARFGTAETLAHHLREEAYRSDWRSTILRDFMNFIVPVALCFTGLGISCAVYSAIGDESLHQGIAVAGRILQFVAPLLGGAWMGFRTSPRVSLRTMLLALLFAIPFCVIDLATFMAVEDPGWATSWPKVFAQLLLWLPLASISALVMRALIPGNRAVRSSQR